MSLNKKGLKLNLYQYFSKLSAFKGAIYGLKVLPLLSSSNVCCFYRYLATVKGIVLLLTNQLLTSQLFISEPYCHDY